MVKALLTLFIILPLGVLAQTKDKVEVIPRIFSDNPATAGCAESEIGKIIFFYEPEYPPEARNARAGGSVNVLVKVGVAGNIIEILSIEGQPDFLAAAENAAQKVKFSPTVCDGKPLIVPALITYNFIPEISAGSYFFPASAKDFADVKIDSPYYEAILDLTDNYKISFGYADKNFYERAPLTRGDFAEFLRLTLDLLFTRARDADKIPAEINLARAYNPQNLTSVNSIKELGKKQPFYKSVGILLQNYEIAPLEKDLKFRGGNPIMKNEVIDLWTRIFGREAVPVNFEKSLHGEQFFTRGEFALFLSESMQVLSYKVLP